MRLAQGTHLKLLEIRHSRFRYSQARDRNTSGVWSPHTAIHDEDSVQHWEHEVCSLQLCHRHVGQQVQVVCGRVVKPLARDIQLFEHIFNVTHR